MLRPWILCITFFALTACSQEKNAAKTDSSQILASSTTHIASAVLNVEQGEDILQSSKQAMLDINASDIATASQAQLNLDNLTVDINLQTASSLAKLPSLPSKCQHYFQRAQACYQTQMQAEDLINMLQQQQAELTTENPDEIACERLARSFDAVAMNLGCS